MHNVLIEIDLISEMMKVNLSVFFFLDRKVKMSYNYLLIQNYYFNLVTMIKYNKVKVLKITDS
jgi:hypothetical protein